MYNIEFQKPAELLPDMPASVFRCEYIFLFHIVTSVGIMRIDSLIGAAVFVFLFSLSLLLTSFSPNKPSALSAHQSKREAADWSPQTSHNNRLCMVTVTEEGKLPKNPREISCQK